MSKNVNARNGPALIIVAVLIGAAAVLGAGLWATSTMVERAVERDASRRSMEWARYAAVHLPRIEEIAGGAQPTEADWRIIDRMNDFGGVFRFKIFSPEGVLRFESDDPTASGASLGVHNETASSVVADGEAYTVVADGSERPDRPDLYSETYLPVLDSSGRMIAIAETYLDQTERTREVREEYHLYGSMMIGLVALALIGPSLVVAALFRRLQTRNRELDASRIQAQASDRAKTQFLATVSHELRTPMNGILGAVQLMELSALDTETTELLGILRASSESQMMLIEEILTFGALEAGRMSMSRDVVDLGAAMKTATGFATIAAAEKGIDFTVDVDIDVPKVVIDGKRLQQIVVNLVGNAIKFTDAGRVELRAGLDVTRDAGDAMLRIAVSDTGPGIEESQHDRIFERFTQVDQSSTRDAGGTGLGLAITRGIVEAMDGTIRIESTPGLGTTFLVDIPVPVKTGAAKLDGERIAA